MSATYLEGRVAIVSGGADEIGYAVAAAIIAAGGSVCLAGTDVPEFHAAVAALGSRARGVPRDGAEDGRYRALVLEAARAAFGKVDLLVGQPYAGAPSATKRPAEAGEVRRSLEDVIIGPTAWARAAWEAGMREHGGAIVNIGLLDRPNGDDPVLRHLTRELASELGPSVRVNAVAPAALDPDCAEMTEPNASIRHALRRSAVEDTAAASVFLLGDAAAGITGQVIVPDSAANCSEA